MKKLLLFTLFSLISLPAFATTRYLANAAAGSANGTSCANAYSATAANFTTVIDASSALDIIEFCDDINAIDGRQYTISNEGSLSAGTTFTVNTTTNVLTSTSHGLVDGDACEVSSTLTLPTTVANTSVGLPEELVGVAPALHRNWTFFVRDRSGNDFKLCKYPGGPAIDITGSGSGTMTVKKVQFITIRGAGSVRSTAPKISGSREIPEEFASSSGNFDTGVNLFKLNVNMDCIKFENFRVEKVLGFVDGKQFNNNHIYIKDVLMSHVREAIFVRGSNAAYGPGKYYHENGSYGWVVWNLDADYCTKKILRAENGMNHATFVDCDVDARFLFGDFPILFHFGTGSSSSGTYIQFISGSGTAPVAGQTITGGTSGATLTLNAVYANPILGGNVAGWLLYTSATGTFQNAETLSNGAGWSATESGIATTDTSSVCSIMQIIRCSARRGWEPQGTVYDNGDGFGSETPSSAIYYEDCKSFDNADGGWDLKGGPHYLLGCICFRDGNRSFRIWHSATMKNCISGYSGQGLITQYADGGNSPIWASGIVNATFCTFVNNGAGFHFDDSGNTSMTYASGNGTLPVIGDIIVGQTTGATARISGYTGNGTSGTLYLHNPSLSFNGTEVITASQGFSSTSSSAGSTAKCGEIILSDSVIAMDASHASTSLVNGEECTGAETYTATNVATYVSGVSGTDPQFPNIGNLYWDVSNRDYSRTYGYAAEPSYINEDLPVNMASNDYNSVLYTTTKGYYSLVTTEDDNSLSIGGLTIG